MLSASETQTIIECAREFGVEEVYLFGSNLNPSRVAHDIDLGVRGVPDHSFFHFYGRLLTRLRRPVDLVDLAQQSALAEAITKSGLRIYG